MENWTRIHYIETRDLTYKNWGLYLWGSGCANKMTWGDSLPITGIDEYGPYWDVSHTGEGTVNFLIYNEQNRTTDLGAKLDPNQEDVWVVAGEQEIYFSLTKAIEQTKLRQIPEIPSNYVRLYYYRPDQDYQGWFVSYWREASDTGEITERGEKKISSGNVGGYFDIPCLEEHDKLKFIVKRGEEVAFGGEQEYPLEEETDQIWMVDNNRKKYIGGFPILGEDKNKIEEAILINKHQFQVRFKEPIEEPIKVKQGSRSVPLANLEEHEAPTYYLTTQEPLDYTDFYTIECGDLQTRPVLAPEIIEEEFTTEADLGADYNSGKTTFRLWAPSATRVKVKLYEESFSETAYKVVPMQYKESGLWEIEIKEDLAGDFYLYEVTNNESKEVLDPYAKSMASFDLEKDKLGRGSIVDLDKTDPEGWQDDAPIEITNEEDIVIYEMSVRDFTIAENSGVVQEKRGTYLGFIEKIPHLKELGITHVQLMPVLNFYFGDESKKDFEGIDDDLDGEYNYNWGYDPHNYFSPEGWYASDSFDPNSRVKELKQLIKALHEAGIGVILDVVYNHTAITDLLEDIVPYYYYRRHGDGRLTNGSGCGNDTASERQMMRKLILDSVAYWTEEYHVDGFRFDLMGLHDEETMKQVKETVTDINPDAIIHGEGWNLGTLPSEQKYVKADGHERTLLKIDSGPAVFNDGIRDALKQGHFASSLEEGGFIQCHDNDKPLVRAGIIAGMVDYESDVPITEDPYHRFTDEPNEVINYVTCHDGYTLWDKIVKSTPHASQEERKRMHKLATAIILTSQGKPFIHGGSEMLRTKPNPKRDEGVDPNSYNSSDYTNQIDWSRKEKYRDIFEYFCGLIELRKTHAAFRLQTMEEIKSGLEFLGCEPPYMIGFRLHPQQEQWKEIVVVYNANREHKEMEVPGINSDWKVVVDGNQAGTEPILDSEVELKAGKLKVPPISCTVIHR